jgi:opacity protein-like surface antigen
VRYFLGFPCRDQYCSVARSKPDKQEDKQQEKGGFVSIRKIAFTALLAVAGMAVSSASMAQFDGFYIGGGFTRFKAFETLDDFFGVPGLRGTGSSEDHQGGFNGNVGYGFGLGILHLAVEASYSNQIGKATLKFNGEEFSDELKDAAAVSILPGLQLGASALIYARIGTAQAKFQAASVDTKDKRNGTLFGLGMKGAVHKNLCVVVEYQNYDFKEKDGFKPEAVGVLLGAQYTF